MNTTNTLPRVDYPVLGYMIALHLAALLGLTCLSWSNFFLAVFLYFMTACIGITFTFHRLLSHRSFKANKWLERFGTTCGVLAFQGPPAVWVAHHRMHHAGSDTDADPHDSTKGFWHSHMGWLLKVYPQFDDPGLVKRYSRDIGADPYYSWLSKPSTQVLLQIVLAGVLYALGGWEWVIWGGFVRLVMGYHFTWFVNSATHTWGYKRYNNGDKSRNLWWVALLTWGEGWHNNHHCYEKVARAGHVWWEIDVTYYLIKLFEALGLVTDVVPAPKGEDIGTIANPVEVV